MPETEPAEETCLVSYKTVCPATVTESWTMRVPRCIADDPSELTDWIMNHKDEEEADFQGEEVNDEHDRDVIKDSIHVQAEPQAPAEAAVPASCESVFASFDQATEQAYQQGKLVMVVVEQTLAAMFPSGDYARVRVDEDERVHLDMVVTATGELVHRFGGGRLPAVPAELAARWGAVDLRQEAQVQHYADAAYQTGAALDALPPVAHEPGEEPDAQCLALRARPAASRIAYLRDAPADQPADAPF